jgi:hypothetical protein
MALATGCRTSERLSASGPLPSGASASASDGASVARAPSPPPWGGGEAILRFPAGAPLPSSPSDYYAPSNWLELDASDLDLGASGVLLFDRPESTPSKIVLGMGKDGIAYLIDRTKMGGLADDQHDGATKIVAVNGAYATPPAIYRTPIGTLLVTDLQGGAGSACPGAAGNLVGLRIVDGAPPRFEASWCATDDGHGSPIVTTTDGIRESIVWVTAHQTGRLRAYNGETRDLLFDGGGDAEAVDGIDRFNTPIAVGSRIFVAATSRLVAFTP